MSKADRLLLILNLIRARKNLRAKDLALECGVSERTIYRDNIALSSAHIPIYFDNGYKFLTDAFLPTLNFTLDEYLTLYLGLNSEIINSNSALKSSAKTALAKLESLIPEDVKDHYLKTKKKIEIELEPQKEGSKSSVIFNLLNQVLSKETKVKLELFSKMSSQIVKEVSIEKLLFKEREWFLVATIEGKKETIPINQIRSATL